MLFFAVVLIEIILLVIIFDNIYLYNEIQEILFP